MKRLCILAAIALLPLGAFAQGTNTNMVISAVSLSVNTNGAIVGPTNAAAFRAQNDMASEANFSNLFTVFAGFVETNASNAVVQAAVDATQNAAISNIDSVAAVAHAGQLTSYAGSNIWTITQTWDFVTASNGTDWTYSGGALWETNSGVKLSGPPFGYSATNQRVVWAQTQTAYAYRVTWVMKSGGWNPNGQIFIPSGVEYEFAAAQSNALTTNTVIITNITQIGFAHGKIYYSPNYVQSVTIEAAVAPTNKVTVGGTLAPDVGETWDLGTPEDPFDEVFARTGPWWKWANFSPASTATASNYTIAVGTTNVFLCLTNSWRGPGTNWARLTLENY